MSIFQLSLNGKTKLENTIERIKFYESAALSMDPDGYYIAYSGCKDSLVISYLAILDGVKFKLHNNHTTLDAPELVYHIRKMKKWYKSNFDVDLEIHYPEMSMWQLIPTKLMRYRTVFSTCYSTTNKW